MLLSHPAYKLRCKPLPSIGSSDHDIRLLDIACKPFKPKPVRRKIYLWKKADIYKIKEDLESFGNTFRNIGPPITKMSLQCFSLMVLISSLTLLKFGKQIG
jgi:hypothetical protein